MSENKKFAELLRLKEATIPAYSVFVRDGYLHHGEYGGRSSHSLRYHTTLIPSSYDVKYIVAFAYEASFPAVKKLGNALRRKG